MLRATLAAALVCFRAPAVWARQLNEDDGANEDYASESYVARYAGSYADGGLYDAPEAYQACQWEWVDDGTCDALCNAAERDWDGKDCFHDAPECYNKDNGADYRGTVNVTQSGLPCQRWSEQFPNTHAFSVYAYPFAGLGGHNLCRNPRPDDGSVRPWCLVDSIDGPEWEYCDVPPPTADRCDSDYLPKPQALTTLTMGKWSEQFFIYEAAYHFYQVVVPPSVQSVEVVLFPEDGDPDLFLSFDVEYPNGHLYDYTADSFSVDTFTLSRSQYGFCGSAGTEANCTLHIAVMAFESSRYELAVFDTSDGPFLCAEGCGWAELGDGVCQLACNTTNCHYDRGDCLGSGGGGCTVDCKPSWIDDGYCDEACFSVSCGWDGADCGGAGCADGCLAKFIDDGECDAECNTAACRYDGADCFHSNGECYNSPNGSDYRGTLSHTKNGHVCQKWSDQYPKAHTFTHDHFPTSGLGGHNYCRNPLNEEATPWCYPVDADARWEHCDVGPPSDIPCPTPPPPPPRQYPSPPPPPPPPAPEPPAPPMPPPADPCPKDCPDAPDGECEVRCNTTMCLWDKGDCGNLLELSSTVDSATHAHFTTVHGGGTISMYDSIASILRQDAGLVGYKAGISAGVLVTLVLCCIACCLRRYRKKMVRKPARAYMEYGPQGADGPVNADTEMAPQHVGN